MITWLEVFSSNIPWKTTLITWATHGNEKIWLHIIDTIKQKIKKTPHEWTFYLLIGNPLALDQGVRFVDEDLNRAFSSQRHTYESSRANEIKSYFKNKHIDIVYDIHSTPSDSQAMIICTNNPKSIKIAKKFPIEHIVLWLIDSIKWTSLTNHFNKQWAVDIAFECGQHNNLNNNTLIDPIVDTIRQIHHNKNPKNKQKHTIVQIKKQIMTNDPNFYFHQKYTWFETIPSNTIRGSDNTTKHKEKQESIIVIPNTNIQDEVEKNNETWVAYIGTEI